MWYIYIHIHRWYTWYMWCIYIYTLYRYTDTSWIPVDFAPLSKLWSDRINNSDLNDHGICHAFLTGPMAHGWPMVFVVRLDSSCLTWWHPPVEISLNGDLVGLDHLKLGIFHQTTWDALATTVTRLGISCRTDSSFLKKTVVYLAYPEMDICGNDRMGLSNAIWHPANHQAVVDSKFNRETRKSRH